MDIPESTLLWLTETSWSPSSRKIVIEMASEMPHYIQNTAISTSRQTATWLCQTGGTTEDLRKAHIFTEAEAAASCADSASLVAWPVHGITPILNSVIFAEQLQTDYAGAALQLADHLIGKGEEGRNNAGPFIKQVFRDARSKGQWCAAFAAYCLEEVGALPLLTDRERRGARRFCREVAKRGMWVYKPRRYRAPLELDQPRPGDVVVWRRGKKGSWHGHAELVEHIGRGDQRLFTIAGNVGDFPAKVQRIDRTKEEWRSRLYGIARAPMMMKISHIRASEGAAE